MVKPFTAPVDITYANYRRLADLVLIPAEKQMVSLDWQWMPMEDRVVQIDKLMNFAEVRDQPEGDSGSW